MERSTTKRKNNPAQLNEGFDCIKMRNLISNNGKQSFSKKFRNWIDGYTRATREKIWVDVEYYKSW